MNRLPKNASDEIFALGKEAKADLSVQDYKHLRKIIWVNRLFLILGYGTAWIIPNPLSMLFIAFSITGMWVVAHHVLHGGYDHVPNIPTRYHRKVFAQKWRRYLDWFDWIYPPAWSYEHNVLHHCYTNEEHDPDQLFYRIRKSKMKNNFRKKAIVFFNISIWKANYYARNTIKAEREKKNYAQDANYKNYNKEAWLRCYIPYVLFYFVIIPLAFSPISWWAALFVLINRIGAELIANWHSFFIIAVNHVGEDIPLIHAHFKNRYEFSQLQLASSCNCKTGGFWNDYFHGYLNYQIEHHLFPDLPMRQYVALQPKIKQVCETYQVPYLQESIFVRAKKLFAVLFQEKEMH